MRLLKSFQPPATYGSRLTGIRLFTDQLDATISIISPFTNVKRCNPRMQSNARQMQSNAGMLCKPKTTRLSVESLSLPDWSGQPILCRCGTTFEVKSNNRNLNQLAHNLHSSFLIFELLATA